MPANQFARHALRSRQRFALRAAAKSTKALVLGKLGELFP
jgi:hypothetical protein